MGLSRPVKRFAIFGLLCALFFVGSLSAPFFMALTGRGTTVDAPQTARAAPKTKTIVFFIGSFASTTQTASAATTTFNFVITLPDMVPDTQPIRSAYIWYNTWMNNTTGITAQSFTLNKQGGSAQTITGPITTGGTNEQQLSTRLSATTAMRNLIGTASGTYAMTFTAKLTGPTRIAEGAELYVTYDYDPLAPTQVNTVYNWVYSTTTILGTTRVTSPSFSFGLPENSPTTTFAVAGSSTNDLWVEYRGFISTSTALTENFAWNAEATSAVTFTEVTQQFAYLIFAAPQTANTSPNSNNTFWMSSSQISGLMGPSALAIATYSYNFNASTQLQKTIQVPIFVATSTAAAATINTTTTINIPETAPSSVDAFLFGRLAFATTSNLGFNAFTTQSACTIPVNQLISTTTNNTKNSGFFSGVWSITGSTTINSAGNWNVCSSYTSNGIASSAAMMLYLTYNYNNNFAAGTRFNTNISDLAQSNMTAGTTFASSGINVSVANASTTGNYSWLDAEYDNSANGVADQVLTAGIGAAASTTAYRSPAIIASPARRAGQAWTATSSLYFITNVTTTVQCSVSCIDDAAYDEFGFTDMIPANFTQAHYHWRYNNGSETTASSSAPEDTATGTFAGTINRLRIEVNNAGDATSSAAFRLEYQKNATSGAWTQVATATIGSAAWGMATSSFVSDGTVTTQIATATGGTDAGNVYFVPGEVVASTSRSQTASYVLTGTQFTEDEFAIFATPNASTNSTYYFRVSNAGTALTNYLVYPAITINVTPPTVLNVVLNGASAITLTPNATTSISVVASTTDPGGPGNIAYATAVIYRTSLGNTCAANNANCYRIPTSSCAFSGSTSTVTCTAGLWYYAQSTGNASSSFPSDSWSAALTVTNNGSAAATGVSTAQNVNVLTAINVTTSTINYATLPPGSNTGSVNQPVSIQNAGNSSSTIKVSGVNLTSGGNSIVVGSEHYGTSSFTYGGTEQSLSVSATTIAGIDIPSSFGGSIGTWSYANALPYSDEDNFSAAYNGHIYMTGGFTGSNGTSTVLFAPINATGSVGAWSSTVALPVALYSHEALAYNGYLYTVGGFDATNFIVTSTVFFAPINSTGSIGAWTSTAPLPYTAENGAALAYNGYLYEIAGNGGGGNTVVFAPINSTGSVGAWSYTNALPYVSVYSFASAAYNGYLYAIGGYTPSATSEVLFAPINSTGSIGAWTSTTAMPYALVSHVSAEYNGYLYAVGGQAGGSPSSSVIFAPINSTGSIGAWSYTNVLPYTNTAFASALYNGYLYAAGGNANGAITSTVVYSSLPPSALASTYWGFSVPGGSATGTYSGTVTFTAAWSN